jgi:sugar phosphate isomerase/epimerase
MIVKRISMNPSCTRRNFIQRAALIPLAAAGIRGARVSATVAPVQRVGGARLKPGLNAYSFSEVLSAHEQDAGKGIDLYQVCDFAAKQNFDAVDLTGYFFPGYPNAPDDQYVFALKRRAQALGLEISGTGVRNDFTTADQAVRAEGVRCLKTWVEVAAKLGAPVVRAFADSQSPHHDWREASGGAAREAVEGWIADALRESAGHGQKFGVMVVVQNHGDFVSTGEEHLSLLKRVDHPWCGALVDTGKYVTEDPYADIALMAPYACNWQIKETIHSRTNSPRTDMKKLVSIIRQSGYRGYVPIETLKMGRKDYDPFAEASKLLAELRAAIEATEPGVPQPAAGG